MRRLTPLRRYACGACGHRGWRLGRLPHSDHPEELEAREKAALPSRPLERRDYQAVRRGRLRLIGSLILAVGLGALAAYRLASCEALAPPASTEPR